MAKKNFLNHFQSAAKMLIMKFIAWKKNDLTSFCHSLDNKHILSTWKVFTGD